MFTKSKTSSWGSECRLGAVRQTSIECRLSAVRQTSIECRLSAVRQTSIECRLGAVKQTSIECRLGAVKQTSIECRLTRHNNNVKVLLLVVRYCKTFISFNWIFKSLSVFDWTYNLCLWLDVQSLFDWTYNQPTAFVYQNKNWKISLSIFF